jgi:hypothetical protein
LLLYANGDDRTINALNIVYCNDNILYMSFFYYMSYVLLLTSGINNESTSFKSLFDIINELFIILYYTYDYYALFIL